MWGLVYLLGLLGPSLGTLAYSWWWWNRISSYILSPPSKEDYLYLIAGVMMITATMWLITGSLEHLTKVTVASLPRKKSLRYLRDILIYVALSCCSLGILGVLFYDGGSVLKALVSRAQEWVVPQVGGWLGMEGSHLP